MCHLGEYQRSHMWKAKSFGVAQGYLALTIYTSSKLVLSDFGFLHDPITLLKEMNKDDSLSTTSYAFVM